MTDPAPAPHNAPRPWHENYALLVGALVVIGPLAIPLIWINRRIPLLAKIGMTVLIVALTVLSFKVTVDLYRRLQSELANLNAALKP